MAINSIEAGVFRGIGLALLAFTAAVIGYQCYHFLKWGIWPNGSVVAAMAMSLPGELAEWAFAPADWRGLHSILRWIPVSLLSFVAGLGFLMAANER